MTTWSLTGLEPEPAAAAAGGAAAAAALETRTCNYARSGTDIRSAEMIIHYIWTVGRTQYMRR